MGIGGVRGKVKVKGDELQEEEDDGLGNFGKCGKKEKKNLKKMKGTVTSSGTPTRLRGKGRQGKSQMSSRFTRDMTDDELNDEPVLGESRIKNEDAEYASLPFATMMADDDTPCPTPRNSKVWGSIPWMFGEDDEEAETERDDCNGAVPLPRSVEEIPSKILRPSTLPLLSSSSSSTKEDDTPTSTKRSKTTHQEKSSPGIITSTATFPKNTPSSSSTPTTYSTILSPPNPSSSATTTTTSQEKEELDKQQDPNANSHSNDLFVSPFWEIAQAETPATSTGESSSSVKLMKKMKEKEKKRSYHIVDIDAAYCSRGNKKRLKRSNDDDDDDDVGGGSSSSSKVGGRGTRKKRIPLAVLEDYPVGQ